MQGYLNLKGYYEFAAENRPEGWNAWVTFSISPAAQPAPARRRDRQFTNSADRWPRPLATSRIFGSCQQGEGDNFGGSLVIDYRLSVSA